MTTSPTLNPPATGIMLNALARNWWLVLLRGICAVLFGLLTFVGPGATLLTLVLFYGAFMLIDGVLALGAALSGGQMAPRWWLLVVGLLGIGAGLVTMLMPGVTIVVLLIFIAAWAITTGVMQIVGAIRLRKEIDNEWMLIASGVLSVLFGVILIVQPGAGVLGLLFVIGVYAIIYGVMLISLALRLRKHSPAKA